MEQNRPGGEPLVSVIIPHLNGKQHLAVCLGALRAQTYRPVEVILVDNGSSDGTQAYVREAFPEVRLLELGQNRGFTGACNAGFRASRGDIVVLLNNDTEADARWLEVVVDTFRRHPRAGSVASKILLYDQRDVLHTAGDYYRVDGLPGNRGVWQQDAGQYDDEEPVFSACGGAAAYRRALIEEIGFLDDAFFFSCEDIDLAWRIHLAGWQVIYAPQAVVYHKLKASAGTGVLSSFHDGRNFLYVIWKNYPGRLLRRHWRAIVRAQLGITLRALRAWRGAAARARLRGQLAGLWGILRMWPQRRAIQSGRRLSDEAVLALLTPVDESGEAM